MLPSEWHTELNYVWRYNGDPCDVKEAHIMLHGANVGATSGAMLYAEDVETFGQSFLNHCDATDAVIIMPESGSLQTDDGPLQQTWDWTEYFTLGQESTDIMRLIKDAKFSVPNTLKVWLHGGSAGGIMAWNVANRLEQAGRLDYIHGVILNDMVSPFSTTATQDIPVNFKDITSTLRFDVLGFDYYQTADDTAQLGFPNNSIIWREPTLIQYSLQDSTIPEEWKKDFSDALATRANDLTVNIVGTGHAIGEQGWENIVDWLS